MSLKPDDVTHWQSWVGREEVIEDVIDLSVLRRYAAALGEVVTEENAASASLAHWAFFLPAAMPGQIGVDGHPKRGGFLPPVSLPRRMFAASDIRFHDALQIGAPARRTSRVASLVHKSGRSGDLILVEVDHAIAQGGHTRIEERQTIVYRDAGEATPAIICSDQEQGSDGEIWTPGPVDLFRFSAVTFNSHRIHYDLPYATREEGYPGLVVHGPFTAARLYGLARTQGCVRRFTFRAQAPIFAGQPVRLESGAEPGTVQAVRCDGVSAMVATFQI